MTSVTAGVDVTQLWSELKSDPNGPARDKLIVHFSPLVKYVAGRVAAGLPHSVESADLVSYGMFGLIDAIEKFDPELGFQYETYAIPRIRGAILDGLRALDWVPRSVRNKSREITGAIASLENSLGRSPAEEEIALRQLKKRKKKKVN